MAKRATAATTVKQDFMAPLRTIPVAMPNEGHLFFDRNPHLRTLKFPDFEKETFNLVFPGGLDTEFNTRSAFFATLLSWYDSPMLLYALEERLTFAAIRSGIVPAKHNLTTFFTSKCKEATEDAKASVLLEEGTLARLYYENMLLAQMSLSFSYILKQEEAVFFQQNRLAQLLKSGESDDPLFKYVNDWQKSLFAHAPVISKIQDSIKMRASQFDGDIEELGDVQKSVMERVGGATGVTYMDSDD